LTTWPRIGKTVRSSTPASDAAPSPVQLTSKETGPPMRAWNEGDEMVERDGM
jgi:hypothetical protein